MPPRRFRALHGALEISARSAVVELRQVRRARDAEAEASGSIAWQKAHPIGVWSRISVCFCRAPPQFLRLGWRRVR